MAIPTSDAPLVNTRTHCVCVSLRSQRAYYELVTPVAGHFGATLGAHMIGAVSPMVLPEDVASAREPSRFENNTLFSVARRHKPCCGLGAWPNPDNGPSGRPTIRCANKEAIMRSPTTAER